MAAPDVTAAMVTTPLTPVDWLVIAPLIIPLMTGALLVMLRGRLRLQPFIAAFGLAGALAANIGLFWHVAISGPAVMMMGSWKAPFGIAFEADRTGTLFSTTASLVALIVVLASGRGVNADERRYGYYPFVMLLMTGVTGAFLTGDLFNLYVWFEVLLISSFGLLVLGSETPQIDAAVKYGLLNLVATTLFLIATGLTYAVLGTLNMADIAGKARQIADGGPMVAIAALFFLAFATKAAAFPVNFWLPASYHTPRAGVSALFAALLTKVGVYALLKVLVLLLAAQASLFAPVIAFVAGATMIVGALGALAQTELRRLLGWLVIAGIGAMMIGVAVATPAAVTGALIYVVHSMLVMAGLYLASGLIEDALGSDNLNRLSGIYRRAPLFSALFLILAFAISGLPPFSGFWAKAVLFKASLDGGHAGLGVCLLVSAFISMIAIMRVFLFAFWRDGPTGAPDGPAPVDLRPLFPRWHLLPLGLIAALLTGIGLIPAPLYDLAARAAVELTNPSQFIAAVLGAAP